MRLRAAVSSQRSPLQRLVDEVGADPDRATIDQGIRLAQTSAPRPTHRSNRKLQPDEVRALVDAYRGGASANDLARGYGLDRHTVRAHLARAGVAMRSPVKMTPELVDRATELYGQGWSTVQIGAKLGLGPSTVAKALKRAGVVMRPAVADRWRKE